MTLHISGGSPVILDMRPMAPRQVLNATAILHHDFCHVFGYGLIDFRGSSLVIIFILCWGLELAILWLVRLELWPRYRSYREGT
jgi:hypothetical protein